MNRKAWLAVVIVIVGWTVWIVHYELTHTNDPQAWNCSAGQKPCIELVGSKSQVIAKFNDFRFCGQNCVRYNDAHNNWITYKGVYQLKWIGPNPASHKLNTSV